MRFGEPPDPVVVFSALHREVGDVSVHDAGDDATIHIGSITHGHISAYPKAATEQEQFEQVTEEVVDFLRDLFSDRVVLHCSADGRSGGWKRDPDSKAVTAPM